MYKVKTGNGDFTLSVTAVFTDVLTPYPTEVSRRWLVEEMETSLFPYNTWEVEGFFGFSALVWSFHAMVVSSLWGVQIAQNENQLVLYEDSHYVPSIYPTLTQVRGR